MGLAGTATIDWRIMADMATVHISESEAARDFAGLLARVRSGAEIVIESDASPVAVLRAVDRPVRLLSESLRMAQEHGSSVTLDGGFARDLQDAVSSHPDPLRNSWE